MKKQQLILLPLMLLVALIQTGCAPLRDFKRIPVYDGPVKMARQWPAYDSSKKTIVILASNTGTEIFDLMAPYHLFNATEKANVYVVAENYAPITLLKGVFIYPSMTMTEIDALNIQPDVIVLPAMVGVYNHPQSPVLTYFKSHAKAETKILSVCVGSLVGAASGIYDGKPITTHASDISNSKKMFPKPIWVSNTTVTQSGNLYSTAGVSNAVEGSLTVIKDLFGTETMLNVMQQIHYKYTAIKTEHQSLPLETGHKFTIAQKMFFKKNRKIGVWLQDGINELELAAVLDTYHRTFPRSLETFAGHWGQVTSKHGLTLLPTSIVEPVAMDELHILPSQHPENPKFKAKATITYESGSNNYIIDRCLQTIKMQYGSKFENIDRLLLDYDRESAAN